MYLAAQMVRDEAVVRTRDSLPFALLKHSENPRWIVRCIYPHTPRGVVEVPEGDAARQDKHPLHLDFHLSEKPL